MQGVIFDLDGVLVTTDNYHYLAWKELADELGLTFNRDMNHQLRGISREASLKKIYENNPGVELPPEEVFHAQCTRKNERYKALLRQMGKEDILPGAVALLEALRAAGVKNAIASASKNAGLVMEQTGLDCYIDALADGRDVTHSKPHPEVFLTAAEKLGLSPTDCLGVEDAASGVEAIHNAGMVAIGIGAQTAGAEVVVDTTQELTVEMLRAAWAAGRS